jgi:hypothetical protein
MVVGGKAILMANVACSLVRLTEAYRSLALECHEQLTNPLIHCVIDNFVEVIKAPPPAAKAPPPKPAPPKAAPVKVSSCRAQGSSIDRLAYETMIILTCNAFVWLICAGRRRYLK